ncbi:hypothetical protein FNF29_05275 [Cafeteria roenbergensis]|uniref:Uncharacterized protein n=1 Tax=Cafeteria roenbergensis TaxID=33653 RepID=A0A5A8CBJ6_CAFRO|nr:hypothetical protein FNF29_05275 [Cafeteria roenbergensis]|eukprot:KAA0150472.1 hypothetical protein FNF29_05275 [Cafeteria roenbergensis]
MEVLLPAVTGRPSGQELRRLLGKSSAAGGVVAAALRLGLAVRVLLRRSPRQSHETAEASEQSGHVSREQFLFESHMRFRAVDWDVSNPKPLPVPAHLVVYHESISAAEVATRVAGASAVASLVSIERDAAMEAPSCGFACGVLQLVSVVHSTDAATTVTASAVAPAAPSLPRAEEPGASPGGERRLAAAAPRPSEGLPGPAGAEHVAGDQSAAQASSAADEAPEAPAAEGSAGSVWREPETARRALSPETAPSEATQASVTAKLPLLLGVSQQRVLVAALVEGSADHIRVTFESLARLGDSTGAKVSLLLLHRPGVRIPPVELANLVRSADFPVGVREVTPVARTVPAPVHQQHRDKRKDPQGSTARRLSSTSSSAEGGPSPGEEATSRRSGLRFGAGSDAGTGTSADASAGAGSGGGVRGGRGSAPPASASRGGGGGGVGVGGANPGADQSSAGPRSAGASVEEPGLSLEWRARSPAVWEGVREVAGDACVADPLCAGIVFVRPRVIIPPSLPAHLLSLGLDSVASECVSVHGLRSELRARSADSASGHAGMQGASDGGSHPAGGHAESGAGGPSAPTSSGAPPKTSTGTGSGSARAVPAAPVRDPVMVSLETSLESITRFGGAVVVDLGRGSDPWGSLLQHQPPRRVGDPFRRGGSHDPVTLNKYLKGPRKGPTPGRSASALPCAHFVSRASVVMRAQPTAALPTPRVLYTDGLLPALSLQLAHLSGSAGRALQRRLLVESLRAMVLGEARAAADLVVTVCGSLRLSSWRLNPVVGGSCASRLSFRRAATALLFAPTLLAPTTLQSGLQASFDVVAPANARGVWVVRAKPETASVIDCAEGDWAAEPWPGAATDGKGGAAFRPRSDPTSGGVGGAAGKGGRRATPNGPAVWASGRHRACVRVTGTADMATLRSDWEHPIPGTAPFSCALMVAWGLPGAAAAYADAGPASGVGSAGSIVDFAAWAASPAGSSSASDGTSVLPRVMVLDCAIGFGQLAVSDPHEASPRKVHSNRVVAVLRLPTGLSGMLAGQTARDLAGAVDGVVVLADGAPAEAATDALAAFVAERVPVTVIDTALASELRGRSADLAAPKPARSPATKPKASSNAASKAPSPAGARTLHAASQSTAAADASRHVPSGAGHELPEAAARSGLSAPRARALGATRAGAERAVGTSTEHDLQAGGAQRGSARHGGNGPAGRGDDGGHSRDVDDIEEGLAADPAADPEAREEEEEEEEEEAVGAAEEDDAERVGGSAAAGRLPRGRAQREELADEEHSDDTAEEEGGAADEADAGAATATGGAGTVWQVGYETAAMLGADWVVPLEAGQHAITTVDGETLRALANQATKDLWLARHAVAWNTSHCHHNDHALNTNVPASPLMARVKVGLSIAWDPFDPSRLFPASIEATDANSGACRKFLIGLREAQRAIVSRPRRERLKLLASAAASDARARAHCAGSAVYRVGHASTLLLDLSLVLGHRRRLPAKHHRLSAEQQAQLVWSEMRFRAIDDVIRQPMRPLRPLLAARSRDFVERVAISLVVDHNDAMLREMWSSLTSSDALWSPVRAHPWAEDALDLELQGLWSQVPELTAFVFLNEPASPAAAFARSTMALTWPTVVLYGSNGENAGITAPRLAIMAQVMQSGSFSRVLEAHDDMLFLSQWARPLFEAVDQFPLAGVAMPCQLRHPDFDAMGPEDFESVAAPIRERRVHRNALPLHPWLLSTKMISSIGYYDAMFSPHSSEDIDFYHRVLVDPHWQAIAVQSSFIAHKTRGTRGTRSADQNDGMMAQQHQQLFLARYGFQTQDEYDEWRKAQGAFACVMEANNWAAGPPGPVDPSTAVHDSSGSGREDAG